MIRARSRNPRHEGERITPYRSLSPILSNRSEHQFMIFRDAIILSRASKAIKRKSHEILMVSIMLGIHLNVKKLIILSLFYLYSHQVSVLISNNLSTTVD